MPFASNALMRLDRRLVWAVRCRHGFTLIELLVVISIIALLIGMLLPALGAARATTRTAVCLSNVKMLATASLLYQQDDAQERFIGFIPGSDRKVLLLPYTNSGKNNADRSVDQIWHCPQNNSRGADGQINSAGYGFNTNMNWVPLRLVTQPSETVCVGDGGIGDSLQPQTATHLMAPSKTTTASIARPNPRHDGKPNIGWIDGHGSTMDMKEPFYPGKPGEWTGNGVTDHSSPDYKDQLWDRF